jgi:CRP-like cAMP-binding protein
MTCQCGHSRAAHQWACAFCVCQSFRAEGEEGPLAHSDDEAEEVMHALTRLCRHPAFEGLTPLHLRSLAQRGRRHIVMSGEILAEPGDESDRLFLVLKGRVAVNRPGAGALTDLDAMLGPGDVVGEHSLLHGARHTATVAALDDVHLLELPREDMRAALHEDAGLRSAFMRLMHERMSKVLKGRDAS